MTREEIIQGVIDTVYKVNDDGLKMFIPLIDLDKDECYNIDTSKERISELNRNIEDEREKERQQRKIEYENAERARQAELIKNNKVLKILQQVDMEDFIKAEKNIKRIAELHRNIGLSAAMDLFNYGMIYGVRKERKRRKNKTEHYNPKIQELLEMVKKIPDKRLDALLCWANQYQEE